MNAKVVRWIILLMFGCGATTAYALVLQKNQGHGYVEYLGLTGVQEGRNAPYRLLLPSCWKGTLLVYARGTGSLVRVDANGQPLGSDGNPLSEGGFPLLGLTPLANGLPEIAPGALIPSPDDGTLSGTLSAFESRLLNLCYALAATDYKPDLRFVQHRLLGWIVEDGVVDLPALAVEAKSILVVADKAPKRTILWGRSQGSSIALSTIERIRSRPKLFDGTITGCTVGAGASRTWDTAIDAALAFDVVFKDQGGWIWGLDRITPLPDRSDTSFLVDVLPDVAAKLASPHNFPRFEFIRLVTGLPIEGFYPFPVPPGHPGYPQFNWLFAGLQFATEVRADVERKAGGAVGQNLDHAYALTDAQGSYLASLGVPAAVLSQWLNEMNARRTIAGSAEGRAYTSRFADFTGAITTPVLTLHTVTDGLVLPSHTTEYRRTLAAAGKSTDLRQVFVQSNGHCTFTAEEWVAALGAMDKRLDSGSWPSDKNLGKIFTFSPPQLRFVPFSPGPFPQPPVQVQ